MVLYPQQPSERILLGVSIIINARSGEKYFYHIVNRKLCCELINPEKHSSIQKWSYNGGFRDLAQFSHLPTDYSVTVKKNGWEWRDFMIIGDIIHCVLVNTSKMTCQYTMIDRETGGRKFFEKENFNSIIACQSKRD